MANQVVKLKKGSDYLYPYANLNGIDITNQLVSINKGQTYQAIQDCICCASLSSNANVSRTIKLSDDNSNWITLLRTQGPYVINDIQFPVKKGQYVKYDGDDGYPITTNYCILYGIKYYLD